jgi:hypothetical protein
MGISLIVEQRKGLTSIGGFIQPIVVLVCQDNDRHSIVDRFHQFSGSSCEDSAGIQDFRFMLPLFPKSGKGKQLLVSAMDMKGLFTRVGF